MTTHALHHRPVTLPAPAVHLTWFAGGAAGAFAVPYLLTSVLDLQHDVYLVVYFAFVAALSTAYVRATGVDLMATIRRHWRLNAVLGVVLAVLLVLSVLSEDATARPGGIYLAFEVVWRGALYGAADGILLTAFPLLVVYAAMEGRLGTWPRRFGFAAATLALTMIITAAYHLGYAQYREDGLSMPEKGNVIMTIPALLTANPVASIGDHAVMHVSAVLHEYETADRLPPQTEAWRGGGQPSQAVSSSSASGRT